jgi:hypothetical protein
MTDDLRFWCKDCFDVRNAEPVAYCAARTTRVCCRCGEPATRILWADVASLTAIAVFDDGDLPEGVPVVFKWDFEQPFGNLVFPLTVTNNEDD